MHTFTLQTTPIITMHGSNTGEARTCRVRVRDWDGIWEERRSSFPALIWGQRPKKMLKFKVETCVFTHFISRL